MNRRACPGCTERYPLHNGRHVLPNHETVECHALPAARKLHHGGGYRSQSAFDCDAPMSDWRVLDRNCNYSAFSGRHYTPSNYSACKCMACGHVWRTKADYVAGLSDASKTERFK